MKILYSAYECNPGIGSDAYVGWSWAKAMSRNNEVHVLTNAGNKESIERYAAENNDQLATFHYISLPPKLQKILKGRKGYFVSYVIWQYYAYRYAKKLNKNIQFDIAHHVAIADFRIIGLLWKLNVPFIFGPVGGGQKTSEELSYYIRNYKVNEYVRNVINNLAVSIPAYKHGARRAAKIFVSNDETIKLMQKHLGLKVELTRLCELGVDSQYLTERSNLVHKSTGKVHIIVSGRLMYRKGIEFLLDVISVLKTNIPYVVDLYGGGHQIEEVKKQIAEKQLENIVILHGKVPFYEMPSVYANADIFTLPSLRETTGTAVIEAMANKLPVVALRQNGVKYLVQNDAGILVDIKSREDTIADYANALKVLIEDNALRVHFGEKGYQRLQDEYTWEARAQSMMETYKSIIELKK